MQKRFRSHLVVIGVVLAIALVLRFMVMAVHGVDFTLHSDDEGYIRSAKTLIATGKLTYHRPDEPTVYIMPGISFFLAAFFVVFGKGTGGLLAAKVANILIGVTGVFGLYLIGREIWNHVAGVIAAFLMAVYFLAMATL